MSTGTAFRLAIGDPNGRRSSVWRIWFGPRDIYAAFRTLAGVRKASIHFPRPNQPDTLRYIGYTKDYAERDSDSPVNRQGRTHLEWRGMKIAPSYFLDFRFRVPESELRFLEINDGSDIHWLPAPPLGAASEVTIISGPPTHVGPYPQRDDGGLTSLVGKFQLKNGRFVWVIHHHIACPSEHFFQAYRDQIAKQAEINRWLTSGKPLTPNARLCLTMDCQDGSASEVELAADFLRDIKIRS